MADEQDASAEHASDKWEKVEAFVPPSWKRALEAIARARALSVADVLRQLIRELMLSRHESGGS